MDEFADRGVRSHRPTSTAWELLDVGTELEEEDRFYEEEFYEVADYLNSKFMDIVPGPNFSLMEFWNNHGSAFPMMQQVAFRLLCIPASSAPAERVFSECGNVISQRRSRLKPKHVNSIIRVKQALRTDPNFFTGKLPNGDEPPLIPEEELVEPELPSNMDDNNTADPDPDPEEPFDSDRDMDVL